MLVLGIETSTQVSSVALGAREGLVGSMVLARGRGHAEFLMPAIRSLCDQAQVSLDRLSGVAVGLGPGLFTGMRVGIATAKTVAQVLKAPIVGISSLDLLAFSVRYTPRLICACIDARRGEVFAAFYRQVPGGVQRLGDYASWQPDALAHELRARGEEVLFVGNGATVYRQAMETVLGAEFALASTQFPTADHLVELALPRFEREDTMPVARVEPLYVRKSDAEIKWEGRGVSIERPMRVKPSKRALSARGDERR